jgi:hypothetical protein
VATGLLGTTRVGSSVSRRRLAPGLGRAGRRDLRQRERLGRRDLLQPGSAGEVLALGDDPAVEGHRAGPGVELLDLEAAARIERVLREAV